MPGLVIFEKKSHKALPPSHYRALKMQGHNNNIGSTSNRVNISVTTEMNGLRAERQTTADQRKLRMATSENIHSSVLSAGWGALPERIYPSLVNLLHQQVDCTYHPQAHQRCIYSACALATVVIQKSDNCQRCCANKCPFVDSTSVSTGDLATNESIIQQRDRDRAPSRRVLCSSARGNWADILKRERKRKELERWRW